MLFCLRKDYIEREGSSKVLRIQSRLGPRCQRTFVVDREKGEDAEKQKVIPWINFYCIAGAPYRLASEGERRAKGDLQYP